MKKILVCCFLIFPPVISFSQLNENFDDGDFSNNPTWSGDTANWVDTLQMLNSKDSVQINYTFYLSTPSTLATNTQWEWWDSLRFQTSSANYADVYLISDSSNLEAASFNGYFVRIGNTSDEISLYKRTGSTTTEIIDGADGTTNYSVNVMRIKVTRNASDLWTLQRDSTGTGNYYIAEGTVTDATFSASNYFGILVKQSTLSFARKHWFDNFYVGTITGDTVPPSLVQITVVSATELDLKFSEYVEITSSENETNYSVNNGIGNPASAVRDAADSALVHLTFSSSFTNGTTYTISISNILDLNGNSIISTNQNFIYFVSVPADFKDVVFNEFMAILTPDPVSLPDKEYIEIYNNSSKVFNLTEWKYVNGTNTKTLPSFILLPASYLILCSNTDTSLFSSYGNVLGISWSALVDGGTSLSLLDSAGNLIDAITYSSAWELSGGKSMELVNPNLPCSSADNWQASNDSSGGTPGKINSVFNNSPDMQAPAIVSVSVVAPDQILVTFSEGMDSTSLEGGIYTISNGITVTSIEPVAPDFSSALLNLSPDIDSSIVYTININAVSDCSGNLMLNNSFQFAQGVAPQLHDILINEIYADPDATVSSLPEIEFVELYNNTSKVIKLNGCKFSDGSSTATISDAVIFPDEYLILCSSAYEYSPYGQTIGLTSFPSLNNAGDALTLKTESGILIHEINYSDEWYGDEVKKDGGWTLEMIDPFNPCGEENNWTASVDASGGTPGKVNSVKTSNPDVIAPQLTSAFALSSQSVMLYFNESLDSISAASATYSVSNGINIAAKIVLDKKTVGLSLADALQKNIIYTATVSGTKDCIGNITSNSTAEFALTEKGEAGDIIINEVLFNPRPDGEDFVEVYNNSGKIINLQNWKLANIDNDTVSNFKTISTFPLVMFPKNYLVFTKDTTNIIKEYPLGKPENYFQISSQPNFDDDSSTVILLTDDSTVSDFFSYSEKMHFALLEDKEGISLERLDFNRSDSTNWHSAAEAIGWATPGYQNSQYNPAEGSGDNVSVEPEIFSPDNDGYNDVVNISYKFDSPGFVATITIYDAKGRLIKTLAKSQLLAISGTFSWDGISDSQEKARIGIYIILFEAFDLNGKALLFKKTCVVAGKLE